MLTATYSLATLSAEQKNTRSILFKLQQHIKSILYDLHNLNRNCVENVLVKLEQFEEYCHRRKVEIYVIPAIRKVTHEADPILEELESLSFKAVGILRALREQLINAFEQGMIEVNKVCSSIEQYCGNLMKRLTKEEDELLPMARGLLPIEEWFNIASKLLSEEGSKKSLPPAIAQLPA
ncbi:MAG: hypothetical protein HYS18_01885 [Burkholderiales bacterium]|nr:hypothetical protein [Burkholderiales bacterium]